MIKVSVMYPNTPGARFDHEYYRAAVRCFGKTSNGGSRKSYIIVAAGG